ncbi:hypothetical protein Q5752_000643 [Cryptotrichosporon argae]
MSSKEIRDVAEAVFVDMMRDAVTATAMRAYREVRRAQAVCGVCGTRCRAHVPLISRPGAAPSSRAESREASPARPDSASAGPSSRAGGHAVGPERGTGGGTGVGSGRGRVDASGNAFFDCLVCGRPVTSSRYAPHLASCLGLSGSTRRGASRIASTKARLGTHDRSSPSPYVHSDNGDSDVDSVGAVKRKKLNGKRTLSPGKTGKKAKLNSGTATPTARAAAAHVPSRLGRPPTNAASSPRTQSPSSSPEKSLASLGGTTGRKTLPGTAGGGGFGFAPSQGSVAGTVDEMDVDGESADETYAAPGNESSDEVDDDY